MATPTLLVSGRVEPRKVIGSVDTSEFLVALAGQPRVPHRHRRRGRRRPATCWPCWPAACIAAPFAAYLVRVIPAQMLGSMVGGIIVLTNSRTLVRQAGIEGPASAAVYLGIVASGSRRWPGRPARCWRSATRPTAALDQPDPLGARASDGRTVAAPLS